MSKLQIQTADIEVVIGEVVNHEVILELTPTSKDFDKQEKAYTKACSYRGDLVTATTAATAIVAKKLFESDKEVNVVTAAMQFGPSTLTSTVHREYRADDSEDTIANYVITSVEDDYTAAVSAAVSGIFDEEEAEA